MAAKKKKPASKKKFTARKPAAKKPASRKPSGKPGKSGKSGKKPARPAKPSGKRRVVRTSKRPSPRPKRPAAKKKVASAPLKPNPQALALARAIAQVALDKKAQDVLIIDTRLRGSAVGYDYIVLATGESDRQLGAMSEGLRETLKPQGHRATSVEASPDWVLVNYDDVVAHFFSPDTRSIYDLEGLWSDAPRVALQG